MVLYIDPMVKSQLILRIRGQGLLRVPNNRRWAYNKVKLFHNIEYKHVFIFNNAKGCLKSIQQKWIITIDHVRTPLCNKQLQTSFTSLRDSFILKSAKKARNIIYYRSKESGLKLDVTTWVLRFKISVSAIFYNLIQCVVHIHLTVHVHSKIILCLTLADQAVNFHLHKQPLPLNILQVLVKQYSHI